MRSLLWTIRIEGRRKPLLEFPHRGPDTVRVVELAVAGVKASGQTAIVNLTRTKRRRTNG